MNQNKLPESQNNSGHQVEVRRVEVSHSESFSGPIPPPTILRDYENILPGLADRIMKMAESQSEHRKGLERKVISHDKIRSTLGLVFAFLIVIAAIIAGVYLTVMGQPITGSIFTFIPLGSIVGAFIYQQREGARPKGKL